MDKEIIYHVMNGDIDLPVNVLTDKIIVEDEFVEGRECGQLYNEVYQARRCLEEKLDVKGKKEVERIIDSMNSILKIFSMKMYDYGLEAKKATNPLKKLRVCGTINTRKSICKAGEVVVRLRK